MLDRFIQALNIVSVSVKQAVINKLKKLKKRYKSCTTLPLLSRIVHHQVVVAELLLKKLK